MGCAGKASSPGAVKTCTPGKVTSSEEDMAIAKELLDILVCPQCRQKVHLNDRGDGLICANCLLLYEIKDDIPVMLVEKAKQLDAGSCQASQ